MIHHITRATRHLIFWSLIAAALGMTAIRLALTGAESYKTQLAARIGEYLDAPVTIGRLGASMRGFSPELVLSDIDVASRLAENSSAIQLEQIRLGINLLDILINRELLASSWVTLVGTKLSVIRKADGSLAVAGLKSEDTKPLWLLQGRQYEMLDSDITWRDEQKSGAALTFESVDIFLSNEGERHRINILMRLPEKYGETLRVSMNVKGNIFEPANLQANAFIEGRQMRLSEWANAGLPFGIDVKSGSGDFQFWGEWRRSKLVSLVGFGQLANLIVQRADRETFPVERLQSRFRLQQNGNRWQLDVNQFLMETRSGSGERKHWPDAIFSIAGWRKSGTPLRQVAVYADRLDLQEASLIARFFMPEAGELGKLIGQSQVSGTLQDFSLFAVPDEKTARARGVFTRLSMAPTLAVPGLDNISGWFRGDEKQGELHLAGKEVRMSSDWFRKPLVIDKLQGTVNWRQEQDKWTFSSPMLELHSLSLSSYSRLRLDFAKTGGQPLLDLQSAFAFDDVSQTTHFLPEKIMTPALVRWLHKAFIKGHISDGGLLFYGKLQDFPFKKSNGVFETCFDLNGLELDYSPFWPHLTDAGGEARIYQDSLSFALHQGSSQSVNIKQAQVDIPAMNQDGKLQIRGELEGEINRVLSFLEQTPLASRIDKLTEAMFVEGGTQIKLDLELPLYHSASARVDGSARLNQAKLRLNSLNLPIDRISGLIRFDEQGISSDTIKARILGQAIRVDINNTERKTLVKVTGRAGIDDLEAQFKLPKWQLAKGASDYRLQLRLPYDDGPAELDIESDLEGISLDLPAALAKTSEQRKKLSLTFNLDDEYYLPVRLDYDNKLKAAIKIDTAKMHLESGHILLGKGEVSQRRQSGIAFEINSGKLALQDWLGFFWPGAADGGIVNVREIKLHADQSFWHESGLGRLDFSLVKDGDYWQGEIRSPLAKGQLQLPVNPNAKDRVRLIFDKLELSAFRQLQLKESSKEKSLMPDALPSFLVTSKNTLWKSIPLGALSLEAEHGPNGMLIKRMELADNQQKLSITGGWQVNGQSSNTELRGRLELAKAGELFAKLGISHDLTETDGVVDFNFNWPAPPYQFSLSDVQGQFVVDFKNGRILSVEPGFGRILGILAMAQWFKRLQLDFRDVYQEGLMFNSIKGSFALAKGKAVTHDLVIDAVPAKISLTGETDLLRRTVDHVVNVTPKSADALPIAGTIMGKVASFVAKSLTGAEHEGFFFGSQYLVKGDWANVQISSLNENNGLLQKTWNGITDFPWLDQQGKH